jgi:hypothetical protein
MVPPPEREDEDEEDEEDLRDAIECSFVMKPPTLGAVHAATVGAVPRLL